VKDLVAAPLAGLTLGPEASDLALAEWTDQPGRSSPERPIAPLHVHHGDDEAWYVLEGRLGFTLDDETVEAGPGSAVIAPRGVRHTFWNASEGPTRYLLVMTRNLQRLIDELHVTGFAEPAATFRKYDSELLG
jgi:mannose-6-phosphate isomerase-like protein (cupin superfamily)